MRFQSSCARGITSPATDEVLTARNMPYDSRHGEADRLRAWTHVHAKTIESRTGEVKTLLRRATQETVHQVKRLAEKLLAFVSGQRRASGTI